MQNSVIFRSYCWLSLALAVATTLATTTARAEVVTGPCAQVTDPNNAPITDARLDHLVVNGTPVNVLVPPHYRYDGRRYPVVYLFHGAFSDEDSFETQTDLLAFTASLYRDGDGRRPDAARHAVHAAGRLWLALRAPHRAHGLDGAGRSRLRGGRVGDEYQLHDPSRGLRDLSMARASAVWHEPEALLVSVN